MRSPITLLRRLPRTVRLLIAGTFVNRLGSFILPFLTLVSGPVYLSGAIVLGGVFLWYAVRMQTDHSDHLALRTFNYSVFYLMALFAFLLLDHWMPALLRAAGAG